MGGGLDGLVAMVPTWLTALAEKETEINTMDRIKVGIVGTGFMAVAHIRAYHLVDGVEIAALCNPSGRHLDGDFSDVHGNVGSDEPVKLDMTHIATYRSLDELLADDSIDLIDLTTPTFLHREQALAALASGPADAATLARRVYTDKAQHLLPAATRNVLAHLIDLSGKTRVTQDGRLTADSVFRLP